MARIVIAEDEEAARLLLSRALELDGHVVHAVDDGAAALDHLQAGNEADLLLTDISMPVMDGIALALAVSRDWPQLPVLYATGYAASYTAPEKGADVLAKPYREADLLTKLKVLLKPDALCRVGLKPDLQAH